MITSLIAEDSSALTDSTSSAPCCNSNESTEKEESRSSKFIDDDTTEYDLGFGTPCHPNTNSNKSTNNGAITAGSYTKATETPRDNINHESSNNDDNEEDKLLNFVENDFIQYDLGFDHDSSTVEFDCIASIDNIPIKVASNTRAIRSAIKELLSYNPSFVGFDCEWRPQFEKGKKQHKISLIQIAHERLIILIRLHKLKDVLFSLTKSGALKVLQSNKIIKCGVGIREDEIKMFLDHGVRMEKCIELNDIHVNVFPNKPEISVSLKKLCQVILQCDMKYKSQKTGTSNWEYYALSDKQILYAAEDSLVGYRIFDEGVTLSEDLLENIEVFMNENAQEESMENCREAVRYIAQQYETFQLNEFCEIYLKLMGWEMPMRCKKRLGEVVWYFDDVFDFDIATQKVSSKIYNLFEC